ncbi:hypothetical protein [Rhodoblastus sp.]|uniref:hypothetical protein n=1 Tax=Rhodoblastus sp. TaxID=1962975 RepID=UPI00261D2014|nr:hypothetical protein [Rhodoblastus sp.]
MTAYFAKDANGNQIPINAPSYDGNGYPLMSDAQSAPFAGAVAMMVGTTYAAQRTVEVICTVAGNVEFQFPDGSTITKPVTPGDSYHPYACTQIVPAGTTATATYFNLK